MIIDANLSKFQSIAGLSRKVGLNPNKLQNGFKEVYNTTVNEYVQHRRLNEASILIKNTDLPFSVIAARIGIRSKSYFSKIFKEKYGLTPSEIRQNSRRNTFSERDEDKE